MKAVVERHSTEQESLIYNNFVSENARGIPILLLPPILPMWYCHVNFQKTLLSLFHRWPTTLLESSSEHPGWSRPLRRVIWCSQPEDGGAIFLFDVAVPHQEIENE